MMRVRETKGTKEKNQCKRKFMSLWKPQIKQKHFHKIFTLFAAFMCCDVHMCIWCIIWSTKNTMWLRRLVSLFPRYKCHFIICMHLYFHIFQNKLVRKQTVLFCFFYSTICIIGAMIKRNDRGYTVIVLTITTARIDS